MIVFMNGVARSYVAGLALAALARLGGAVAQSPRETAGALGATDDQRTCGEQEEPAGVVR